MACNYLNFRQLEKINTAAAAANRNIYDIFIMRGDEAANHQQNTHKKPKNEKEKIIIIK